VFSGFPPDALAFYRELEDNNSREWWQANKRRYEEHVRAPMELLLDGLFDTWGEAKVFRPSRDVRFSKDKSPYKTAIGAIAGGHYVQLSADGLMAGGGFYELSRDQLARFRAVLDDPRRARGFKAIAEELEAAGMPVQGSELATAPRGFAADHPEIRWLRHKRVYAMRSWKPARWLHTKAALQRVDETWSAVDPLVRWLQDEVGPPQHR
jgi:uncharacterized protein (TIGR02453 family)